MENYIQANWPAPPQVHAYTTTRLGGISKASYASFNLATHVEDDPEAVRANREKLKQDLLLPTEPSWLQQTHSAKVICLDDLAGAIDLPADASYTTKSNMVCAVLTADCLPLLLCAKDGSLVAAIHAGWQGLAAGIIEATLDALVKIINPQQLLVWLGPAIGPKTFLVQDDVRQKFLAYGQKAAQAFQLVSPDILKENRFSGFSTNRPEQCGFPARRQGASLPVRARTQTGNGSVLPVHDRCERRSQQRWKPQCEGYTWQMNIYTLARQRLHAYNIAPQNIYGGTFCTYTDKERFFSYRRDQGVTGRMASLIWILNKGDK